VFCYRCPVDEADRLLAAIAFANDAMEGNLPAITSAGVVAQDPLSGEVVFMGVEKEGGWTFITSVEAHGEELERQTAYLHLVRTHLDTAKACPN
jgi:hypothetical protein